MPLDILYVSATKTEADILNKISGIEVSQQKYLIHGHKITPLITGVGSMETAWSMIKWFCSNENPDIVINAGIAGSFREDIRPGDVVLPVSDCFADSGVEDGSTFLTLHEAGLSGGDTFPFSSGKLFCKNKYSDTAVRKFRPVNAVTVNTATGSELTLKKLKTKFNPDIETLEGATFFYICIREKVPFLAIRAVSNMVEARNKSNWDIPLALKCLSEKMEDLLLTLD